MTGRWHGAGWDPFDIAARLAHFAHESYDVLVASESRANAYIPFRALKGRVPLRLSHWGDLWGKGGLAVGASRFKILQQFDEKWEKDMKLEADGTIAASQKLCELGREWGVPDSRICWIPHGTEVDLIQRLPKEEMRKRMGLGANQPVIGYLGYGWGPWYYFFLPELQKVVQRFPRVVFICIGKSDYAPFDKSFQEQLQRLGLAPHFRFAGFMPSAELGNWLACADLFLVPLASNSTHDYYRWPGKLSDYLAAGRPVIAPDVGETGRFIREENVGLVVRGDLSDFEDRVCELLEDKALAEHLGTQARRVAEECLAWPVLVDRLEQFIKNLGGVSLRF
jgi:glycosyltransferase involved in cell wall biosynthesis